MARCVPVAPVLDDLRRLKASDPGVPAAAGLFPVDVAGVEVLDVATADRDLDAACVVGIRECLVAKGLEQVHLVDLESSEVGRLAAAGAHDHIRTVAAAAGAAAGAAEDAVPYAAGEEAELLEAAVAVADVGGVVALVAVAAVVAAAGAAADVASLVQGQAGLVVVEGQQGEGVVAVAPSSPVQGDPQATMVAPEK